MTVKGPQGVRRRWWLLMLPGLAGVLCWTLAVPAASARVPAPSQVLKTVRPGGSTSAAALPWSAVTAPVGGLHPPAKPTPDDDQAPIIFGVSCPEATTCVAGGEYNQKKGFNGLIEVGSLANGKWAWSPTDAPMAGLSPANSSAPEVELDGMACPAATRCVGVGQYADAQGGYDGLVEAGTASAGSWSWKPMSAPTTGLSPAPSTRPNVDTVAVSCGSATSCVATGQYETSTQGFDGLVEIGTFRHGAWSWVPSSAPTTGSAEDVFLYGVSCESATSCVAVGSDLGSSSGGVILTGTESSGAWSWVPTDAPTKGLSPAAGSSPGVTLQSVSCASATCVAGGTYTDAAGHHDALIETGTMSDGAWTWAPTAAPTARLSPSARATSEDFLPPDLYGVSCKAATSCVAVGNYFDRSNDIDGLTETGKLSNGSWKWVASTAPSAGLDPPASSSLVLYGVSCVSSSCVAGGQYDDTSGDFDAVLESRSGST